MSLAPMLNVACLLQLATAPVPVQFSNILSGEGLRVEWSVTKSIGPTPDSAEIRVYNMARTQRLAVQTYVDLRFPMRLMLHIGWGKAPELLFFGQAWRIRLAQKTGTDIITTFECGDGLGPARDTPPGGGAAFGLPFTGIIAGYIRQLGLIPSPDALAVIETAAGAVPLKAWQQVHDRSPVENLHNLLATLGLTWGVSSGQFVVYRNGLRNDLRPAILTPLTGLLTAEPLVDGGIEFTALAQPKFVPGMQVQFSVGGMAANIPTIVPMGGPVRVETVSFTGSSEGPSTMSGVARKVEVS